MICMKSVDNHKISLYQYDPSHLNNKFKKILHFELKRKFFFGFQILTTSEHYIVCP